MNQAEEIQQLREEVRYLKEKLTVLDGGFPREWRLTVQESRLLRALVLKDTVKVGEIIESVWWDRDEPSAPEQQIRVVMVRVRKKLAPYGIVLNSQPHYGYWLDLHTRVKLRERLGL